MMRRLFWRIFAAFWVATVVVLLAFAWIATSNFETEKIPGLGVTRLQAMMDDVLSRTSHELRHNGEDETRRWLRSASESAPIGIYVFDSSGNEMLGRSPPAAISDAAGDVFSEAEDLPDDGSLLPTHDSERMRARAIRTKDGHLYSAVATLEGTFFTRLILRRPRAFWSNILAGIMVSAVFSLLLAWYVAAPLTQIRDSTRRFAEGELDARVGKLRFGRSAEMTALACEFDNMAARIKALIDSHRRLVRDVSHELRSPLARMRVALELARDGDEAQVHASLDRIESESARLETMLSQALELSRLETQQRAAQDTVALDELLEDVITNADYEGAPRGRKVVLADCERQMLSGSRDALYSAFENVIRNALAYTQDGTTVTARLLHDPRDARYVLISVRDHGPGVPEGELVRIFEPFYRTDSARTRSSGGTGLGLAIARRAVEWHGGSIVARNAQGGGLEVTIRLPTTFPAASPQRV
ncbi:MAG TPA: ATP-binding protein [Rhodanobacteraceae bacterium]|jgi:two-component system sensor histidine kinase CpxA|nr:ATP-binding protein [Rhodanobacteraceae bacterium]